LKIPSAPLETFVGLRDDICHVRTTV